MSRSRRLATHIWVKSVRRTRRELAQNRRAGQRAQRRRCHSHRRHWKNPQYRQEAKAILKSLKAPLYYVPGNHDVHTHDVNQYRAEFGKDYYRFQVKSVGIIVIDSQQLGSYDKYEAASPASASRHPSGLAKNAGVTCSTTARSGPAF